MRLVRLVAPAMTIAGAATVPNLATDASASTKAVHVCSLVTTSVATAISGVSSKCSSAAPTPGPGSTQFSATWAGKSTTENLIVTVSAYTNSGALSLAKKNLNQGFPGGKPAKLTGVGTAAYQVNTAGAAAIHFSAGSDVVYIILTKTGATPKVSSSLIALARSIAGKIAPAKHASTKTTVTVAKTTTTVSSSLSGSWSGSYKGTFSGTFSLSWQQAGSKLSGTIRVSSLGSGTTSVTGTVQGNKITFGTVGSQAIQYTGTFSGTTMSGSWTLSSATGSWSAKKS